jgi:hypothetical protein
MENNTLILLVTRGLHITLDTYFSGK